MFPPSKKQAQFVDAIEHSPAFARRVATQPAPIKPNQGNSNAQRLAVALKLRARPSY